MLCFKVLNMFKFTLIGLFYLIYATFPLIAEISCNVVYIFLPEIGELQCKAL
jgi:hypothetical protein